MGGQNRNDSGHMNGGFEKDDHKSPFRTGPSKDIEHSTVVGLSYKKNEETAKGYVSEDIGYNEEGVQVKQPMVGFFALFRFADKLDVFYMVIGTIAALAHGLLYPINIIIYGQVLDLFIEDEIAKENGTTNGTGIFDEMKEKSVYFSLVAVASLVCATFQILLWMMAAERQAHRIRQLFLRKVMNQSIGWFDTHQTADISTRLADDVERIQNGTGDKLATFIQRTATFIGGYTLGFSRGWELALVIMSLTPIIVAVFIIMARLLQKYTALALNSYASAGAIAEESLSAIRTVAAFGGEGKESSRYAKNLKGAKDVGVARGLIMGLNIGCIWMVMYGSFALAMWYGSKMARERDDFTGGNVLQVFMGMMFGSMNLAQAAPTVDQLAGARGAAAAIFEVIDAESEIDPSSEEGKQPESIEGHVEFTNVSFVYPSRPDVQILKDFSISVNVGQTVALVGSSGCGKSTTVQLLQRFYDPMTGSVKLDGTDIRDLNINWLRQHIGVVSQEPVLFATTILENIRYGKDGVSDKDIERAARKANAHDFIMKLPQQYKTLVGERGAQLSGGQKQRIAIARALVRNPKILLLDEATSALDTESEHIVQDALDKASKGRTTIVIAHRLSTIKNADLIIGMDKGEVKEMGNHEELMRKGGIYYTLATNQTMQNDKEKNEFELSLELLDDPMMDDNRIMFDRQESTYLSLRSGSLKHQPSHRSKSLKTSMSRQEEKEELEDLPPVPVKRIFQMNSPEFPYIVLAVISSVYLGAMQPAFGAIFSGILGNFAETDDISQAGTINMFVSIIAAIGVVGALANAAESYFFSKSGENLTMRLRELAFSSMLRQDIGWFDDKRNNVGALTTRLARDAAMVQGATGSQIGIIVQSVTALVTGLLVAFIFGWRLAIAVVGFLPFTIGGGFVQARIYGGRTKDDQKIMEKAGEVSSEAVDNIRTVQALSKQKQFEKIYETYMEAIMKRSIRKIGVFSFFFGFTQSAVFFCYAATFGYGSYLVDQGLMQFTNVFRVFMAMLFTGMAVGRAGSLAPDFIKAKISAAKIFMMVDRIPEVDSSSKEGEKPPSCTGEVEFSGAKFSYPSRPGIQVLQGLDLQVKPGQTLALVGSSGCGKSTTVQLIERFYDTAVGVVKLDGNNVKQLNVQWLRSQLGIVSQEPVLFDASIKENIAYGDNTRDVTMSEIIEAARKSNIHGFIESLPMGYETNVGDKGTQLSGGQKQRVAIARALIRNPKVLLLDEATSALDTESEKIVQEALDRAREGRTCIVIAHRLSTITNADMIAVIHNGTVVEQGTHSELLTQQGFYYRLQQAQNRTKKVLS